MGGGRYIHYFRKLAVFVFDLIKIFPLQIDIIYHFGIKTLVSFDHEVHLFENQ